MSNINTEPYNAYIRIQLVHMAPVRKSSALKCNFTKKPKQYWDRHHQIITRQHVCSHQTVAKTSHQSLLLHKETEESWGVRGCCQAPPPSSPCLSGRQLQPSYREKQRVSQSCDPSGCQTLSTLLLPPMWEHHGQRNTILFISDWCADYFHRFIQTQSHSQHPHTHRGQKESSL